MPGDIETLPTYETRSFATWLYKATELYFKNPENQKRFEEWKRERSEQGDEN